MNNVKADAAVSHVAAAMSEVSPLHIPAASADVEEDCTSSSVNTGKILFFKQFRLLFID
jgi:hypothetical protein